MKRFAQIDHGIVTGILMATTVPLELPRGRSFVEVTAFPEVREFDLYDGTTFTHPVAPIAQPMPTLDDVLTDVRAIRAKVGA